MSAAGRPVAFHPRYSWLVGLQDPVPADFLHTLDRPHYAPMQSLGPAVGCGILTIYTFTH